MFDRFTDRARKVMGLAKAEAQRLNHEYIGTEHLLLGLVAEGGGVGAHVLQNLGLDLRRIRAAVEEIVSLTRGPLTNRNLPFTPRAKRVLELAVEEAGHLGHNYVGTEHLLIGMIQENEGIAARVLLNLGATLDVVRPAVIEFLGDHPSMPTRDAAPVPRFTHRPARIVPTLGEVSATITAETRNRLERVEREAATLRERLAALEAARAASSPPAVPSPTAGGVQFSPLARELLGRAAHAAKRLDRLALGTEHLLLGLLDSAPGSAEARIAAVAADRAALTRTLEGIPGEPVTGDHRQFVMPFATRLRQAIAAAQRLGEQRGRQRINLHLLLLGVLEAVDDPAVAALAAAGVDCNELRAELRGRIAAPPAAAGLELLLADLQAVSTEIGALRLDLGRAEERIDHIYAAFELFLRTSEG